MMLAVVDPQWERLLTAMADSAASNIPEEWLRYLALADMFSSECWIERFNSTEAKAEKH